MSRSRFWSPSYYCVVDFEATCWEEKSALVKQQEIIEFPIVLMNAHGDVIENATFHHFIRPVLQPVLSKFCTDLTGITQETVDTGVSFDHVMKSMHEFLRAHNLFDSHYKPLFAFVTCGDWDFKTMLPRHCSHVGMKVPLFMQSWVNLKRTFGEFTGTRSRGMLHMLEYFKLDMIGRHHSGIDDAHNIASCLRHILKSGHPVRLNGGNCLHEKVLKNKKQNRTVLVPDHAIGSTHSFEGLIDIGVNLSHKSFRGHVPDVLERAVRSGVGVLICTGTSVPSSRRGLQLAREDKSGRILSTAGVHPHDAKSCNSKTIATLASLAQDPRVVAIGECGLDFDRNFSAPDVQIRWFEEQIRLACDLQLPLFLHERKAHEQFVSCLLEYQDRLPKVVVHCFTGTKAELDMYLSLGFYIGITGWICDERRGRVLQSIVKHIPLNRLMIETDAPFLTPRNIRPRPRFNEPQYLSYVVDAIAEHSGRDPHDIALASIRTTKEFFGLE